MKVVGGLKACAITVFCFAVLMPFPLRALDLDGDGASDHSDNCIFVPNPIQRDSDLDGFGNYCDPDFNGDMVVNAGDTAYLKSKFFTNDPDADLNGDGVVNAGDLSILKSFFFKKPGPSGAAPSEDLQVLLPSNGEVTEDDTVNVYGIFSGDSNSGVLINGKAACVDGNAFYLNNVSLQSGASTISAVLSRQAGAAGGDEVSVIGSPGNAITVNADGNCGVAPLTIDFEFKLAAVWQKSLIDIDGDDVLDISSPDVQQFEIDFDGDGTTDASSSQYISGALGFTYTQPGVYETVVTITDRSNAIYTEKLYIVVLDPDEQELFLKSIWDNIFAALAAGDKELALGCITSESSARYRDVFDALIDQMPAIAGRISGPENIYRSSDYAESVVIKNVDGVNKIFFINYMKDADGIWRIDSM